MTAPKRPALSSILLHWTVAVGVAGMLAFGYWISTLPKGPGKTDYVQLHKSFGMIVLILASARVLWRLRVGFPAPIGRAWERGAARASHGLLIALTLVLPLSGVVRSLTYARPVAVFGLPVIPQMLAEKNVRLNEIAGAVHDACALALAMLIVLHVAVAAKHHFVDRDDTLKRMRPMARGAAEGR
ncbi:cytochrome b [Methylopila sp. M107]|uniref:cytochrome b n=1 Tax=Methylopila sp. M107 TaxID=1101190 RepID=UPI00036485F0|nr:cytochrome b [Methylopila sp. M107]